MLNLIKTFIFGAILGKFIIFGLDAHILDAKTYPLIPFLGKGGRSFLYI